MQKNNSEKRMDAMFFNKKIVQEIFENRISLKEIGKIDAIEFVIAVKTIHFIMQNIISEKMLMVIEAEKIEKEKSAFDEYDEENGYTETEQETEQEGNMWKTCGEIVDRLIKAAISLLKNSYSQCMQEDAIELLEYLKFELDTMKEN